MLHTYRLHVECGGVLYLQQFWRGSALMPCCRLGCPQERYRLRVLAANPLQAVQLFLCLTGRYASCVQTLQKQAEAQERAGAYADAAASYGGLLQGINLVSAGDEAHMQARKAWCQWQSGQAKAVSCKIPTLPLYASQHHIFRYSGCQQTWWPSNLQHASTSKVAAARLAVLSLHLSCKSKCRLVGMTWCASLQAAASHLGGC